MHRLERPAQRRLQSRCDQVEQNAVVGLKQVMAVEAGQFVEVEARRRLAHGIQVEPGDGLWAGNDLVVAVAPTQAQKMVAKGFGQIALLAIGLDAQRAVALGKLGAVGTVDQRNVGEARHRPVQGAV